MKARPLIQSRCLLGEGPVWYDNRLWWVDIEEKQLLSWNPENRHKEHFDFPDKIGFAVPTNRREWMVGLQSGINFWDPETQALREIYSPEKDCAASRFNDGKCDPQGRLWAGTINLPSPGEAALYQVANGGTGRRILTGITISNGLAWSMCRGEMYYIDTKTARVDGYAFNQETGEISNRRTVLAIPAENGVPDGMTIDSDGMLWVALWGGFGVIRVDPADGSILTKVDVPAPQVTSCTFGSNDLDTLYITTARVGMSETALAAHPEAGNVFAVKPGVRGLPVTPFVL